jgi:hypothetical protein
VQLVPESPWSRPVPSRQGRVPWNSTSLKRLLHRLRCTPVLLQPRACRRSSGSLSALVPGSGASRSDLFFGRPARQRSSAGAALRRALLASSLPLLGALNTVGVVTAIAPSATAAAQQPVVSAWGTGEIVGTIPVWTDAPSQPANNGWQVIDTNLPQPSTWQNGPADVDRPPPSGIAQVRGLGRGFTVNGYPYPDISLKLPNAFALDQQFFFSAQLAGTNRVRGCNVLPGESWSYCADGEVFLELTPLRGKNASLGVNWMMQSLSSRNTSLGSGQSIGFKGAVNLTPTLGLAFGGEQIIQFDGNTDLGRNYYLLLSQAIPLSRAEKPPVLVATAGIGSDFFGYGGNGVLGSTNCIGGGNISSKNYPQGTDCYWGPVGGVSLAINDRISLGVEWFGYGLGAGVSVRPFHEFPLTASFYAIDFLGNTPSYIQDTCTDDPCETRYYGRLTYSF